MSCRMLGEGKPSYEHHGGLLALFRHKALKLLLSKNFDTALHQLTENLKLGLGRHRLDFHFGVVGGK